MTFIVVIPARYQSQRFPGKMLAPLAGKPMLAHVVERARASDAAEVIVATDDARIERLADDIGVTCVMTSSDHTSGSSRLAQVCELMAFADEAIIVNVQGDEPLIAPENINQVANLLRDDPTCRMASLYEKIEDAASIMDPNVVKVVLNRKQEALYFSRAPIPWDRQCFPDNINAADNNYLKHVGLYAYRVGFLKIFTASQVAPLATQESLEQLTPLWYGEKIKMALASVAGSIGVDTEKDLAKVAEYFSGIC